MRNVYSGTVASRKTEASTPDMIGLHNLSDEPPAVLTAGAIIAFHRRLIAE